MKKGRQIICAKNTAVATPILCHCTPINNAIAKRTVKIIFQIKSITGLLTAKSNWEAESAKGLGIADRQIKIKIGIAGIHLCPKTIGT